MGQTKYSSLEEQAEAEASNGPEPIIAEVPLTTPADIAKDVCSCCGDCKKEEVK